MNTTLNFLLLYTAAAITVGVASTHNSAQAEVSQTQRTTYSYDANRNGIIEPSEFTTYIYQRSDTDGDGFLGDEEWNTNIVRYYNTYQLTPNTYSYWDKDKDNRLDANEIDTLVSTTELYTKWDTNMNGQIDADEFAQGTFKTYDFDNDGNLSLNEWQSAIR